jgi:hypothetical protein
MHCFLNPKLITSLLQQIGGSEVLEARPGASMG